MWQCADEQLVNDDEQMGGCENEEISHLDNNVPLGTKCR
jgi:hypothetical protein